MTLRLTNVSSCTNSSLIFTTGKFLKLFNAHIFVIYA